MLSSRGRELWSVDTETWGVHPDDGAVTRWAQAAGEGFEEGKAWYVEKMSQEGLDKVGAGLASRDLIFHNARFDMWMLWNVWELAWDRVMWWDTMVAVRVLDPVLARESRKLEVLGERYWGHEAVWAQREMSAWLKATRTPRSRLTDAPLEVLVPYAKEDVQLTWKLYWLQMEQLEVAGLEDARLLEREMELARALWRMEQRGVRWNSRAALMGAKVLRGEAEALERRLPFKTTKPAASRWFFLDERGPRAIPTEWTDVKGEPAMNKNVRAALIEQKVEWAQEYDLLERHRTATSMWYEGWTKKVGADGRLRTEFNQCGTVSMRLSSTRVNLQAIPHNYRLTEVAGVPTVRELIVAGEGKRLVELDASQAEMRIATVVARCRKMRDMINDGVDAHDATCIQVFGYRRGDGEWDEYRGVAKRLNFAMLYGVGVRTLVAQFKQFLNQVISEGEARELLDQHRGTFPEYPRAAQKAEDEAVVKGHVVLCSGMKRWFGADEQDHLRKAYNQVVQGGVAEVYKDIMIEMEDRWPGTMLLQIHDSSLVELDEEGWEETAEDMRQMMVGWFRKYFDIAWEVDLKVWGK